MLLLEELFERPSFHELHPEPDPIVDPIGAVDGHDVRVTDAGQ